MPNKKTHPDTDAFNILSKACMAGYLNLLRYIFTTLWVKCIIYQFQVEGS